MQATALDLIPVRALNQVTYCPRLYYQPAPTKNVALRTNQYRIFSDPVQALALARAVVRAKIANQRTLLMRCLRSRSLDDPAQETADGLHYRGSNEPAAREMAAVR